VEVQWTGPPGGLVTSPTQPLAVFAEAGTYALSVRDTANGCLATDSLEVRQLAPETVYFELQQPDCLDTTGTLRIDSVVGGLPPWTFSVDGRPFEPVGWFSGLGPGSHTLTVEDAAGCRLDTAFAIEPVLHPVLALIGPVRVALGDSVVLVPQLQPPGLAVAKIHWQPDLWLSCTDCLEPVLKPEAEGQFFYSVVVETAQHCTAEASVMVRVVFDAPVYVPNVFSPDGDGDNDVLVPQARAEEVVRILEFAIYDRWGELMHLARDFPPGDEQGGWDGRVGDQKAPPAVYVWTLRAWLANGKEVSLQGDVLLIR